MNGGDRGGVRILLLSEVTPFKYNVSTLLSPIVACNRKEKSLRRVAMIAKFLHDNKSKIHLKKQIRTVSNFNDFVKYLRNFLG